MSDPAPPDPQTSADEAAKRRSAMQAAEASVLHLAEYLGRPISLATLREALGTAEDQETPHSPADLVRAAIASGERSGLRSAFGRRALTEIEPAVLPAIVFPATGNPVVVHARRAGTFIVHDPALGSGLIEQPAEVMRDWSGGKEVHVLSFKPELDDDTQDTAPGSHRHWMRGALLANGWTYAQVGLASAVVNILALVVSLFTMVVYDRVLPSAAIDSLLALSVGVAIALMFDFIIKVLRSGFIDHAGQRADLMIGMRLFNHLVDIEMVTRRRSVGEVAASMRELESLRDFFTSATMTALVDLPFVLLFIAVIYALAGPLAIVPAIAVPLVLLVGVLVQPALSRISDRILADGQIKQSVLVETLTGIETIKSVGALRHMRARWNEAMRRQSLHSVKSRALTQGAINATGFLQQAAQVSVIVYGALLVVSGDISPGVLIAAVILTGRALAPLGLITQTLTRFHQAQSAYRNLDAIMQTPSERPPGKTWVARNQVKGAVRFDNVRFSYPDQKKPALDGLDFEIAPGEHVAIMGPVGSGKSTIARLLLGLYAPQEGVVSLDGIDARQFDPAELRRNFGVVLQDNWMVSGSLRENIALGSFNPSDAQILRAARLAGLEHFAAKHPDGYNMRLTERGGGLSGGQRQMVALARALLSDPPILVFDEPTASMDAESEARFVQNLKPVIAGRTLIIMTHRQSMLQVVDRVIVLDEGRIKADGARATRAAVP